MAPLLTLMLALLLQGEPVPAPAPQVAAASAPALSLAAVLALPAKDGPFTRALRAGRMEEALACALQQPPAPEDLRARLALAFAQESQGRWQEAATNYDAATLDPVLQDWARLGLARTSQRLAQDEPDPLRRAALEARAQWLYLSLPPEFPRHQEALELVCLEGDGASALEACDLAARHRPSARLLLATAQRFLAAGQSAEALEYLDGALALKPKGILATTITTLRKAHFGPPPASPPGTGLPVLDQLFAGHSYRRVVQLIKAELPTLQVGSRRWCQLSLLAGRSLTRMSEESQSLPWLTGILQHCQGLDSFDLDMALYLLADNAWKAGKAPLVREAARAIRQLHPASRYCDDILLLLARAELREGNQAAAREAIATQQDRYPKGDMVPDGLFLLQFDAWQRGDFDRVRLLGDHFGPRLDDDRDYRTQGRLRYWAARAREQLRQGKAAKEAYADLVCRWPLSWYSMLALQRLEAQKKGLGQKTFSACEARAPTLPSTQAIDLLTLPSQAALQRGLALLTLGLNAWAAEELSGLVTEGNEPAALAKAALLASLGNQVASHDLLRRQAPALMTSFPGGPNRFWWELAYPRPHRESLERWARAHGIPWELAFAITREESGFNPRARSHAKALGLMQLLAKTARWVGKDLGLKPRPEELFQPDLNVRLGTRYLAMLKKDLGHLALAVAGYNCGGGCVKKLRKRHPTRDLDQFVELIPYAETNRYTKRVLSSLAIYNWLYGKDFTRSLPPLDLPRR